MGTLRLGEEPGFSSGSLVLEPVFSLIPHRELLKHGTLSQQCVPIVKDRGRE